MTMPDQPFTTESGVPLVGSPMLEVNGRAASSPDNAQGTHFFLINDSGTYFLRRPTDLDPYYFESGLTPEKLIAYAEKCKLRVLDHRLDFPREYPCYLGRNKYCIESARHHRPAADRRSHRAIYQRDDVPADADRRVPSHIHR